MFACMHGDQTPSDVYCKATRPRVNTPLSDIDPPVQSEPGVLHKVVQRQPRAQEDRLPRRLKTVNPILM